MKNLFIKVITGFREDQHYAIPAEEAHKAYYLFLHPEERGIFSNGVALVGKNIQAVEPDYHTTMGWNKGYELGPLDHEELSEKGIDRRLRDVLSAAKQVATLNPALIKIPLSEAAPKLLHGN